MLFAMPSRVRLRQPMNPKSTDDGQSFLVLYERQLMSELEAIRFWHLPVGRSPADDMIEIEHAQKRIAEYRSRLPPNPPATMLPLLWLRFFREAGLAIDSDALDVLQELQHDREAEGKVMLYLYASVRNGKDKKIGPAVKGNVDRKLLGRTAFEMLVCSAPESLDEKSRNRWPYGETWTAKTRKRTFPTVAGRKPESYYEKRWRGTTKALKLALNTDASSDDPVVQRVGGRTASTPYKSAYTRAVLIQKLQERYPELATRTATTISKVLTCFIAFKPGAPLKSTLQAKAS